MTWPAKATTVEIPRRARSRSTGSTSSRCRRRATRCSRPNAARAPMCGSLARDMGRDLGCFGHIADLRRTEVDPFTAEDFVTIAELEKARFGEKAEAGADTAEAQAAEPEAWCRTFEPSTAAGRQVAALDMSAAGRALGRRCPADQARQSGSHPWPRRAGRGGGSLRHRARPAGRHRRDRGRNVPAEARLRRLAAIRCLPIG